MLFVPQFSGPESVLLAAGILGATVMPHVIFLHSSLTQKRIVVRTPAKLRLLFKFELTDVVIAMGVAGLINAAMLIMAASTFYRTGLTNVGTIQEAHQTLQPLLGKASSMFFALALLASGLSSSSVGTMAGQVIMQGFFKWHIPVWIRRMATMVPVPDRHPDRFGSHPHPGHQPGGAQLWAAVCSHPIDHIYLAA